MPSAHDFPLSLSAYQALLDEYRTVRDELRRLDLELAALGPVAEIAPDGPSPEASAQLEHDLAAAGARFSAAQAAAQQQLTADTLAARETCTRTCGEAEQRAAREREQAEQKFQEDSWIVTSIHDEKSETSPRAQIDKLAALLHSGQEQLSAQQGQLDVLAVDLERRVERQRQSPGPLPEPSPLAAGRDAARHAAVAAGQAAQQQAAGISADVLLRVLDLRILAAVGLVTWAAITTAVFVIVAPDWLGLAARPGLEWPLIAAGIAFGLTCCLLLTIHMLAAQRFAEMYQSFLQALVDSRSQSRHWQQLARRELQLCEQEFRDREAAIADRRQKSLLQFAATRDQRLADIEALRVRTICSAERQRDNLCQAAAERHNDAQLAAEVAHQREVAACRAAFARNQAQRTRGQQQALAEAHQRRRDAGERRETVWRELQHWLSERSSALAATSEAWFPTWEAIAAAEWSPATAIPPGIRLGNWLVRLEERSHDTSGLPLPDDTAAWLTAADSASERATRASPRVTATGAATEAELPQLQLPAVLPFPDQPSLLLKVTTPAARTTAVSILQTAMLRLLTQLPPGDLRFTIIDAQGLGENFAAFMHLADSDELLISNRIWTEPGHIEQQLANLTEHMENVFQKYLRNEFASIEDYNRHAGEVAEPYRVLVIANFPAGFTERAAQRLTSIITSGARCGVHTLLSVDPAQPAPRGFDLASLEGALQMLSWDHGHFVSRALPGVCLPLLPDAPPPPALWGTLIRKLGELSRHIRRVEVPFHRIAPREEAWWTEDSRTHIEAPLGRAGATRLQALRLGKGTSQHVLVAGKTGSGKSTLLHVIILNLALRYSPAEIEFYLIDFKKGVEFKTYATHHLPHARVISIESDREFAVSTLERLNAILQERGERFRAAGVHDIATFRDTCPGERMPRLVLMVDEFQEFFVEDDRYSQTATLLLDRLVRQGRAFGIHVLLGSQTLGGAYSLARTTIGQMAVRIALQCSETDSHLILSEDNTAARLLTRPGEAIYNDANGLVAGNNPFQVAWLGDDQRDTLLARLDALTTERGQPPSDPVIFEGNVPADPALNRELGDWIAGPGPTDTTNSAANLPPRAWLGDAVAITGPTAVTFTRRSGCNLLIVGTESSAARGMLQTACIALACQANRQSAESLPESGATAPLITICTDPGTPTTSGSTGWSSMIELFPGLVQSAGPPELPELLARLAAEVETRRQPAGDTAELYLVIDDLARFRDLRKSDDDFGFGSATRESCPSPAKLLSEILREGPAVGIHVLVWCDSYHNLDRWLSRQMLREFEQRVVLQMSAADSSQLIDSPAASRLGPNRALLFQDDRGSVEKFRPYGLPAEAWLASLRPSSAADDLEVADDISEWLVT